MKRGLSVFVLLPAVLWMASCGSSAPSPVITINPTGASLNVNTTQQFTATIQNLSSTLVNWEVNGTVGGSAASGTISTGGLYTAPATVPSGSLNVVTVTAVAQAQTSLTAAASVTIVPAAAIVISPTTATVSAGTNFSFLATVGSSALNTGVTWEVNGMVNGNSTIGTVSGGLYTAPLIPPAGGTVTVTAVEQNDATQTASATVTITLGTATIQGAYTFSMSGITASGPFARAGVFFIGVNGTITNGTEDLNGPGLTQFPTQFTGLYSLGADGRGTMQFCEGSASNCTPSQVTSSYRIVVLSTQQVQILPIDSSVTGSGEADPQSSLNFGPTDLTGCYTFDFSGMSAVTTLESAIGYFCSNGSGGIVPSAGSSKAGELDINVGGAITNYQLSNSTYVLTGSNRGTMTLVASAGPTIKLSFYMVSPGRAKFLETDALPVISGDAVTQQTPLPALWSNSALNAPIVFRLVGAGSQGGIGDAGLLIPNGSGSMGTGSALDQNYVGNVTSTGFVGTYNIDSFGRGTMTIPASGANYVFYMVAQNSAVLEQYATGLVSHGVMKPQTGGPFSVSNLSGSYGLSVEGQRIAGPVRENLIGQFVSAGAGAISSGTLDINDFGSPSPGVAISSGTLSSVGVSAAGRGNMTLTTASGTRNYVIYFVSPTQAFVVGTDSTDVGAGSVNKQF